MDDQDGKSMLQKYGGGSDQIKTATKHPCYASQPSNRGGGPKLVLRLRNGNRMAFDYSYLPNVEMDGAGLIVAPFLTHKVTIMGRNLVHVFEGLVAHRLSWVAELDAGEDTLAESDLWITEIRIEEV